MDIVKQYIQDNFIMVFSKSYCPYCHKAKELLKKLGLSFNAIELDNLENGSELQSALKSLTGQSTVPNIFIGGTHVGGFSDLSAKNDSGELKKILESTSSS